MIEKIAKAAAHPFKAMRMARMRSLMRQKSRAVNVTEFRGRLCISVDGVPVLPAECLEGGQSSLPSALEESRKVWVGYMLENE